MTPDERLRRLEKWLRDLYRNAEKEMRGKWDEYMSRQEKRAKKLLEAVREAKTDEAKKAAEEKYRAFLKSKTSGDEYYRNMVSELARQYANADIRAQEIINGQRSAFYADGYNFTAGGINRAAIAQDIGIRFDLCSADAVEYLYKNNGGINMPTPRYLEYTKDTVWNAHLINSQVAQGIVQGESIPKIAKRLTNVTDSDYKACVRRARTMATNCQNAGRTQSMINAESWGVKVRKRWICTHDDRTRHSHLLMDGETIGPEETYSNGCRWPGDPIGPPAEVWNCRCTEKSVIDGFSSNLPKGKENAIRVWVDGEELERGKSYLQPEESEAEKAHREAVRKLIEKAESRKRRRG